VSVFPHFVSQFFAFLGFSSHGKEKYIKKGQKGLKEEEKNSITPHMPAIRTPNK
jgi:hypothetical protein